MFSLHLSSAILNAGYKLSQSHCKPSSFKTDAPQKVVWDILRAWEKENPVSQKRLKEGTVSLVSTFVDGKKILKEEIQPKFSVSDIF